MKLPFMKDSVRNYFMFIRISEEKYIDALQRNGHIYCNTIQYFRTIEDNNHKGDKNEGKAFLKQIKNFEILLEGKTIGKGVNAQLYYEHPDDKGNIYCMYGVESTPIDLSKKGKQKINIEDSSKELGKYALLILDIEEFLKRIDQSLNKISKDYHWSPVHYFDSSSYEGELSPFYKSQIYQYQNEVRIWIPNKEEKPFEFYIGDISDISYKVKVENLNNIEVEVVVPAHNIV